VSIFLLACGVKEACVIAGGRKQFKEWSRKRIDVKTVPESVLRNGRSSSKKRRRQEQVNGRTVQWQLPYPLGSGETVRYRSADRRIPYRPSLCLQPSHNVCSARQARRFTTQHANSNLDVGQFSIACCGRWRRTLREVGGPC
jgi:hypothetical protein